jgi:hypothetical protein
MCWHHACPKPICDPCNLPHFGYFETCWHPWPFPADFSHCGSPPPAALVQLNPMVHPSSSLLPPITPSTPPTFVPSRPPVSPGAGGIPSTIDQILEFPPPRKIETDR